MGSSESESDVIHQLNFYIHDCSGYSENLGLHPECILEDKPSDAKSRWSSGSCSLPQYLVLKLVNPAIIHSITFGKFESPHVCNIKKLKVVGGLTEDTMISLLECGLKNDNQPETFAMCHTVAGHPFPVRYVKILPLETWVTNVNFSIWFVALHGNDNITTVQDCIWWHKNYRENEAMRLCMKYCRQYNPEAFTVLSKNNIRLEDPLLTRLHDCLVKDGNFPLCEDIIIEAAHDGLFQKEHYQPVWKPIDKITGCRPGKRGGHQMCIDCSAQTIYLFGGWNGRQDMSDFWEYYIPSQEWKCLSQNTAMQGGPNARSCHKMCIDTENHQIFTIGHYLDPSLRVPDKLKSDFYMYDIDTKKWNLLSEDTAADGGPQLVFDHQMVIDVKTRTIYIFGGRILSPSRWDGESMLGLFSYHIPTGTWTKLRDDCGLSGVTKQNEIKSRIGHVMLFHSGSRQLFILAGQRHKEYLCDFFIYNIDSDTITYINSGNHDDSVIPGASFITQKATIDTQTNEICVLSGLSRCKEKKEENIRISLWIYSISENKWSCIYQNANKNGKINSTDGQNMEPCPRFAHQLVYDEVHKIHYLFGGNPRDPNDSYIRLDDFWSLALVKPSPEKFIQKCIRLIRKQRFKELVRVSPISALDYLQNNLYAAIDFNVPEQVKEFEDLAASVFSPPLKKSAQAFSFCDEGETKEVGTAIVPMLSSDKDRVKCKLEEDKWKYLSRSRLFNLLCTFFPESMTQPRLNLVDLIPY